jgi:hypothetical protein
VHEWLVGVTAGDGAQCGEAVGDAGGAHVGGWPCQPQVAPEFASDLAPCSAALVVGVLLRSGPTGIVRSLGGSVRWRVARRWGGLVEGDWRFWSVWSGCQSWVCWSAMRVSRSALAGR